MVTLIFGLDVYDGEGGIQRFSRRLATSLKTLSASDPNRVVAVVSLWDTPQPGNADLDVAYHFGSSRRKGRMLLNSIRAARLQPVDVVIFTHVLLTPLGLLLRLLAPSAKQVLMVYGDEVWLRPSTARRWIVSRVIDRIAAVTEFTAQEMRKAYRLEEEQFTILPCAVDPLADGQLPSTQGQKVMLTVSRLAINAKAKHIDQVLRAVPAIRKDHPDMEYVIVGDGDLRPQLEQLSADLGLDGYVKFAGWLGDKERDELYSRADLFVLPSTQEGFGIVYLEAWRFGLPVVAGNAGAAPEVVADSMAGICVAPDPDAIADSVSELFADPARRLRMGAAGMELVRDRYSDSTFTENLGALLASL
jgi:phosphatidylinositol alpha-1,6-mannosyltransferase